MSTLCQAAGYRLGQGLQAGDFLFSGYGNFVAEEPRRHADKWTVDELSLFVNGAIDRWLNPFVEAELSSTTLIQEGGGRDTFGRLVLERAYDDLYLTGADTLRLGKMLSPVGDWNLIHAAPLVPTIVRPLTTFHGFSEYSTACRGCMSRILRSFRIGRCTGSRAGHWRSVLIAYLRVIMSRCWARM